jgi:hypothetical protein
VLERVAPVRRGLDDDEVRLLVGDHVEDAEARRQDADDLAAGPHEAVAQGIVHRLVERRPVADDQHAQAAGFGPAWRRGSSHDCWRTPRARRGLRAHR